MKLTESMLRNIIKEELKKAILEGSIVQFPSGRTPSNKLNPSQESGTSNVVKLPRPTTKNVEGIPLPPDNLNLIGIDNDKFSNEDLLKMLVDLNPLAWNTEGFSSEDESTVASKIKNKIMNVAKIKNFTESQNRKLNYLIQFIRENGFIGYGIDADNPQAVLRYIQRTKKKYGGEPIIVKTDGEGYVSLTGMYETLKDFD